MNTCYYLFQSFTVSLILLCPTYLRNPNSIRVVATSDRRIDSDAFVIHQTSQRLQLKTKKTNQTVHSCLANINKKNKNKRMFLASFNENGVSSARLLFVYRMTSYACHMLGEVIAEYCWVINLDRVHLDVSLLRADKIESPSTLVFSGHCGSTPLNGKPIPYELFMASVQCTQQSLEHNRCSGCEAVRRTDCSMTRR